MHTVDRHLPGLNGQPDSADRYYSGVPLCRRVRRRPRLTSCMVVRWGPTFQRGAGCLDCGGTGKAVAFGVAGLSRVGWALVPFLVIGPLLVVAYDLGIFFGGLVGHTDVGFALASIVSGAGRLRSPTGRLALSAVIAAAASLCPLGRATTTQCSRLDASAAGLSPSKATISLCEAVRSSPQPTNAVGPAGTDAPGASRASLLLAASVAVARLGSSGDPRRRRNPATVISTTRS